MMQVMFFKLIGTYVLCSFITLLMYLIGILKIRSPKNKDTNNIFLVALFSWYFPITMYMIYKSTFNNYNKEE